MWKNIKIFQNKKTDSLKQVDANNTFKSTKQSQPVYKALTPTEEVENSQGYFSALNWALKNDDVCNIAISGPYGSGKSSVLESFFKKSYKNKKDVVRISLAAFNLGGDGEEGSRKDTPKTSIKDRLEAEILKQLFYSVEPEKIPKSRYKKVKVESWLASTIEAIGTFLLICTCLYLFYDRAQIMWEHVKTSGNIFLYICISGYVLLIYVVLFKFCEWLKRIGSIRLKIKFFGNEVEANKEPESDFKKNMHEIIYFFEQTKKKVVVFEDLDRFDNTDILVSLRDLNYILNNREKSYILEILGIKNRPVKFIYAIKDDMFLKKGERTKFFDFIIPIIPYISSTNSGEILRKRLELDENTNKSKISDISGEFINLISPFIDDMRNLTCICNEFFLYKETLKNNQDLKLNDEKMFAMMVFKNLYPKDFAELEDEKPDGIVKKAFDAKHDIIEDMEGKEKVKIEAIRKECMRSIKELKLCLLNSLFNFQEPVIRIQVDGKEKQLSDLLDDNFDMNSLIGKKIIVYGPQKPYNAPSSKIIDDIKKTDCENDNYFNRISLIKEGLEKDKEASRKAIEEYEHKIRSLKTYTIKVLIEESGTSFLESVLHNDLLVFLFQKGYIDETYADYINYFHPNSITTKEKNFILSVRLHRASDSGYDHSVSHASRVYEQLEASEFKQKEILDYDLTDYVLSSQITSTQAQLLMENLSDHSEESMRFIKAYIERGKYTDIFIKYLCKENLLFWRDVEQDNGISLETKYHYLELMLRSMSMDDIFKQDCEAEYGIGWISGFMVSHSDSLKGISRAPIPIQIDFIERLLYRFKDVEIDPLDESVKNYIFDNHYFVLNPVMLERIFEWKAPALVEKQRRKNYSCILELREQVLLDYVRGNFTDYINQVVLGMESNTEEDKEAVEDIIERLQDNADLCLKVLDKERIIWDDINECCAGFEDDSKETKKKIWDHIFDLGQVKCSWNNIEAYYDQFEDISSLEKYFDNNIENIIAQFNAEEVSEDLIQELFYLNISEQNFERMMHVLRDNSCSYNGDLDGFSAEDIRIMVNEHVLPFTKGYWDALDGKTECRICFGENNKDDFIQMLDDLHLKIEELCALLRSKRFEKDVKLKLVKLLKADDLGKENVALTLASLEFLIPKEFATAIWKILNGEDKKKLLLNQMENYTDPELSELFKSLPEEYHSLADRSSSHTVKLEDTEYNQRLLEKLKSKGYISSWRPQKDGKEEGQILAAKVRKCAEPEESVRGGVFAN